MCPFLVACFIIPLVKHNSNTYQTCQVSGASAADTFQKVFVCWVSSMQKGLQGLPLPQEVFLKCQS